MNKVLVLSIVIVSGLYPAEAQWNLKYCNVPDIEHCTKTEFECLWERAEKNFQNGKVATLIGSIAAGIGLYWGSQAYDMAVISAYMFMTAGLITVGVGVPVMLTGANRKSQLKRNPHFEALNSRSLNLYPTIRKNQISNAYSIGLTASLKF